MLPVSAFAAPEPPSQAGQRKLEGGQRDFLWPIPGQYNITSCYLDNREHYSLDIDGETGDTVIASYDGTVIEINNENKTTGWGNYVLLQHTYTLANGSQITLYSRYAHLDEVSVPVGDSVTAGQTIGTVGSTGTSTGSHLDYDITYGGTSPSSTYSLDPFVNELLEMPSGLYTTGGKCCQDYVAYVKAFYTACAHETYNAQGNCTGCGEAFDWKATSDASVIGNYTVPVQTTAYTTPYSAEDGGTTLPSGEVVLVNAKVTNAAKEKWYEVSLPGKQVYVPVSDLNFNSYLESRITGELTTLTEGQSLRPIPHRVDGVITSLYPLRKVTGYLDGKWYGSWSGQGNTTQLHLGYTDLNNNLSFSKLAPGQHTLVIVAVDSTDRPEVQVLSCTFVIEGELKPLLVTFTMEPENQVISVTPGQALGTLPVLEQVGSVFLGWFTQPEGGEAVTAETAPIEDMILYPRWESAEHTVTMLDTTVTIPHGACISEFPEVSQNGYQLAGWFTADGEQVTVETPITSDLVLYPQWETRPCILFLDAGEGSVSPSQIEVTVGGTYGKLPVPVREGYVFAGWRLRGQTLYADTKVAIAEDHTAVAIWTKESSSVTKWIVIAVAGLAVLAAAGGVFWLKKNGKLKIKF